MKIFDQWLAAAHAYREARNELPIVLGLELYEYFDQEVTITEARPLRSGTYRIVVEGRFGQRQEVDSTEVSLRPMRINREGGAV